MAKAPKLEIIEENKEPLPGFLVLAATLHQAVAMPGFAATEKSVNQSKLPGCTITFDGSVLWIEHKGKRAFIPAANVAGGLVK